MEVGEWWTTTMLSCAPAGAPSLSERGDLWILRLHNIVLNRYNFYLCRSDRPGSHPRFPYVLGGPKHGRPHLRKEARGPGAPGIFAHNRTISSQHPRTTGPKGPPSSLSSFPARPRESVACRPTTQSFGKALGQTFASKDHHPYSAMYSHFDR